MSIHTNTKESTYVEFTSHPRTGTGHAASDYR